MVQSLRQQIGQTVLSTVFKQYCFDVLNFSLLDSPALPGNIRLIPYYLLVPHSWGLKT